MTENGETRVALCQPECQPERKNEEQMKKNEFKCTLRIFSSSGKLNNQKTIVIKSE